MFAEAVSPARKNQAPKLLLDPSEAVNPCSFVDIYYLVRDISVFGLERDDRMAVLLSHCFARLRSLPAQGPST